MIATDTNHHGNVTFTVESRQLLTRVYGDSAAVLVLTNAYAPASARQHAYRRTQFADCFGAAGARRLREALRTGDRSPGPQGNDQYLANLMTQRGA